MGEKVRYLPRSGIERVGAMGTWLRVGKLRQTKPDIHTETHKQTAAEFCLGTKFHRLPTISAHRNQFLLLPTITLLLAQSRSCSAVFLYSSKTNKKSFPELITMTKINH